MADPQLTDGTKVRKIVLRRCRPSVQCKDRPMFDVGHFPPRLNVPSFLAILSPLMIVAVRQAGPKAQTTDMRSEHS
jgi:hypothetical protein